MCYVYIGLPNLDNPDRLVFTYWGDRFDYSPPPTPSTRRDHDVDMDPGPGSLLLPLTGAERGWGGDTVEQSLSNLGSDASGVVFANQARPDDIRSASRDNTVGVPPEDSNNTSLDSVGIAVSGYSGNTSSASTSNIVSSRTGNARPGNPTNPSPAIAGHAAYFFQIFFTGGHTIYAYRPVRPGGHPDRIGIRPGQRITLGHPPISGPDRLIWCQVCSNYIHSFVPRDYCGLRFGTAPAVEMGGLMARAVYVVVISCGHREWLHRDQGFGPDDAEVLAIESK